MSEARWSQGWGFETLSKVGSQSPASRKPEKPSQNPSNDQGELARLKSEIQRLTSQTELQQDEILALRASSRAYTSEIASLTTQISTLQAQATHSAPLLTVGREVRLRYLEKHRQRMGTPIGRIGFDRIKAGDRAAHRGRPVVDALLCLTNEIDNAHGVYADLYGVRPERTEEWKRVPEMMEVMGFRASLMSEGRLTGEFQGLFERLVEAAEGYGGEGELRRAFGESRSLQLLQGQLQDCYDKIVAENAALRIK